MNIWQHHAINRSVKEYELHSQGSRRHQAPEKPLGLYIEKITKNPIIQKKSGWANPNSYVRTKNFFGYDWWLHPSNIGCVPEDLDQFWGNLL